MVATRNQKIDQDSYLPPSLHLQNLAPYISTELRFFFFALLPLPHALGTRELTLTSPRLVPSVHWQPEAESTVNPIPGGESRLAWDSVHLWSSKLRPLKYEQWSWGWSKDVSCWQLTCQVKVLDAGLEREISRFPSVFHSGTIPCCWILWGRRGGEEKEK